MSNHANINHFKYIIKAQPGKRDSTMEAMYQIIAPSVTKTSIGTCSVLKTLQIFQSLDKAGTVFTAMETTGCQMYMEVLSKKCG